MKRQNRILLFLYLAFSFFTEEIRAYSSPGPRFTSQERFSFKNVNLTEFEIFWNNTNHRGRLDTQDLSIHYQDPNSYAEIPTKIQAIIQLHVLLRQHLAPIPGILRIHSEDMVFTLVESRYPDQITRTEMLRYMISFLFSARAKNYLERMARHTLDSETRVELYTYLAFLSDNWLIKKNYLDAANRISSDPLIRKHSQILSLEIAIATLTSYRDLLAEVGVFRYLGMNTFEDGEASFTDVAREIIFNTGQIVVVGASELATTITKYSTGDYDKRSYLENLDLAQQFQVHELTKLIQTYEEVLELLLSSNGDLLFLERSLPAAQKKKYKKVFNTPFIQQIALQGYYQNQEFESEELPLPSMSQLGFEPQIDFIDREWQQKLLSEVNIFNVLFLLKGPAMIEKFAATRIGSGLIRLSGLKFLARVSGFERLIHSLETRSKASQRLFLYVVLHLADGHEITWFAVEVFKIKRGSSDHESRTDDQLRQPRPIVRGQD